MTHTIESLKAKSGKYPMNSLPRELTLALLECAAVLSRIKPEKFPDHACAKCIPYSEIIVPDWECTWHSRDTALTKLKEAGVTT